MKRAIVVAADIAKFDGYGRNRQTQTSFAFVLLRVSS
jgi:hypothetical protein